MDAVTNDRTPVRRIGGSAVGRSRGANFAVSRRCRHQLADPSQGHVDAQLRRRGDRVDLV